MLNSSLRYPQHGAEVPAFQIKRRIAAHLATVRVPHVVVRPAFYLENLLGPWTLPGIVKDGVLAYPLPATLAAAWASHDDVARAVVAALERTELDSTTLDVAAERDVTGPELAAALARHLGRSVRYAEIASDHFEAALAPAVGTHAASAITALYRWIHAAPDTALFRSDPQAASRAGLRPTPLDRWIAAQRWELGS